MATITLSNKDRLAWLQVLLQQTNASKTNTSFAAQATTAAAAQAALWDSLKVNPTYAGLADGDEISSTTGVVVGKGVTLSADDLTAWLQAQLNTGNTANSAASAATRYATTQAAVASQWTRLKAAYPGITDANSIDATTGKVI